MKILLCTRQDYHRNFGGDSTQVLKTAKYLEKLGAEVHINNGGIFDYSNYDIIHLFNINKVGEVYNYYKIAHKYKKKIVTTPVYYNLTKYFKFKNYNDRLKLWEASNAYRQEVLSGSASIIANSYIECEHLNADFNIDKPCNVIYNGIEVEDEQVPLYNLRERYNLNSYVLCVGKVCNKKNQLALAKACNKLGIQLLLIGQIKNKDYFMECMKYKNVLYLGFMDSYNIYNAYRFAKLHVLTSYIETPGFSSLEAAASGCNIVSTLEGCAGEYFKDMAIYCNPYDDKSIYESVEKGLKKEKTDKLKSLVKENYSWDNYVSRLYECYKNLL
jgi:glycosyltransferase involved in cell wall biosynthesis